LVRNRRERNTVERKRREVRSFSCLVQQRNRDDRLKTHGAQLFLFLRWSQKKEGREAIFACYSHLTLVVYLVSIIHPHAQVDWHLKYHWCFDLYVYMENWYCDEGGAICQHLISFRRNDKLRRTQEAFFFFEMVHVLQFICKLKIVVLIYKMKSEIKLTWSIY